MRETENPLNILLKEPQALKELNVDANIWYDDCIKGLELTN
jgi:hypothetical protein